MSWIDKTESVLNALGLPYDYEKYDGSSKQLPDTYLVYTLIDDNGKTWADNTETSRTVRIQISLYYRVKSEALTVPDAVEAAFMAAGFLRSGGRSLPYNKETGHYGRYFDFRLYEKR